MLAAAVILVLAQLLYALWPNRDRNFLAILLLTAAGVLLGQGWQYVGLPGLGVGEANLLPAALFALLFQAPAAWLGRRLSRRPPGK